MTSHTAATRARISATIGVVLFVLVVAALTLSIVPAPLFFRAYERHPFYACVNDLAFRQLAPGFLTTASDRWSLMTATATALISTAAAVLALWATTLRAAVLDWPVRRLLTSLLFWAPWLVASGWAYFMLFVPVFRIFA